MNRRSVLSALAAIAPCANARDVRTEGPSPDAPKSFEENVVPHAANGRDDLMGSPQTVPVSHRRFTPARNVGSTTARPPRPGRHRERAQQRGRCFGDFRETRKRQNLAFAKSRRGSAMLGNEAAHGEVEDAVGMAAR